jgi:hypothetical protein
MTTKKAPANYRQVFLRTFNHVWDFLRVEDVTHERLYTAMTFTKTVSTSVLNISDFFTGGMDGTEVSARFQVLSGGPVNFNSSEPPTAGGTEGSTQVLEKGSLEVTGYTDVENLRAVLQTAGSSAEVRASLVRRKAN